MLSDNSRLEGIEAEVERLKERVKYLERVESEREVELEIVCSDLPDLKRRVDCFETVQSGLEIVRSDVSVLKGRVACLVKVQSERQAEVGVVRSDVSVLKGRVEHLVKFQSELEVVRSDLPVLKDEVSRLRTLVGNSGRSTGHHIWSETAGKRDLLDFAPPLKIECEY
jgi:predicted nuclease with TOPRIM domain